MKAYPLHFPEKAPKGTKQGAKLPEVSKQGREIGVFLAFSRLPSSVERIEQDLRSEANNKVLKRQLEVLISILLHKKAVRKKWTALAPPGGIEPSTAP